MVDYPLLQVQRFFRNPFCLFIWTVENECLRNITNCFTFGKFSSDQNNTQRFWDIWNFDWFHLPGFPSSQHRTIIDVVTLTISVVSLPTDQISVLFRILWVITIILFPFTWFLFMVLGISTWDCTSFHSFFLLLKANPFWFVHLPAFVYTLWF